MAAIDLSIDHILNPLVTGLNTFLPRIPAAVVTLVIGMIVIRIAVVITKAILHIVLVPEGLKGIIVSIVGTLGWILLFFVELQVLGLGQILLVFSGSLALIGLALAAGGGTLTADILAGISLAEDPDFNVGDEVIAGENGTQGVIERLDIRRTRLRDKDGLLHIVPNSLIERKEWIGVSQSEGTRAKLAARKATAAIKKLAKNTRNKRRSPNE